jgi:hypothetical protein
MPTTSRALYKLGLAYAALAKFQESANTLQAFVDRAPAEDPRVAEAKVVIKDLIVGNNLEPPKSLDKKGGKAPARKSYGQFILGNEWENKDLKASITTFFIFYFAGFTVEKIDHRLKIAQRPATA